MYSWENGSLGQSLRYLLQHAPRRTGMWSQVCGGPSPSALPQSLLSLQDSGPHPLLLGQRFSNLRGHQNPRGVGKTCKQMQLSRFPEVLIQLI